MKKEFRIKKNKEFQHVFKNGKSFANRQFIIYVLGNPVQEKFRIGLSVSKKIGNSVMRNRIKRCIRQSIFELQDSLKAGQDYVIIARKPVSEMDFHQIKSSLIHVLRVAKVLQKTVENNQQK
ncbi:ribonuclease P protein component [Bacillus marasmi]|uniref:ribonuclease P protein component n=1 Tax=Bacillus marasmi TaxID=1926279 RepID=UPI0011CB4069|nr:ribonuclease P protein component [Bacillus marasmi]